MKKLVTVLLTLVSLFFALSSEAHRDSDIDNFTECIWNQRVAKNASYNVECNDLYHLYSPKREVKLKKTKSVEFGAFNIFKLGSGDARFKDLELTANILKNYDLVAVSEVQPSTSEEYESNINLAKHPALDFKKYYHKPGYLKLLEVLRKSNSSWSLILSPSGQSDTEELLGFYYRSDRVQPENSQHCKLYNRNLREKKTLFFAGGYGGPRFEREVETPHLNKSYGCLLSSEADENDIFRQPFSTRFKTGSGFDFQYLSFHARFSAPIAVGGACGFECLERVNRFLNEKFHVEGAFLRTLDSRGLKFLKNHLNYIALKKGPDAALFKENGPVIKYKISKPRVYSDLMSVRALMLKSLPSVAEQVWKDEFSEVVTAAEKNRVVDFMQKLFEGADLYEDFEAYVDQKKKVRADYVEAVASAGLYAEVLKRSDLWTAPEKIARFNELSLVLEGMEDIADLEKDNDVLLGGDLNLEDASDSYFWRFFRKNFRYSTVAIGSPTSISKKSGLSKAYDHFMYDSEDSLQECQPLEASVLDFVNDMSHWSGFEKYFVKSESAIKKLSQIEFDRLSQVSFVNSKGEPITTDKINVRRGFKSCWDGQVYKNQSLADVWRSHFECRTLNQFLNGPEPFRIYTDFISDHLPIGMKCTKTSDLD